MHTGLALMSLEVEGVLASVAVVAAAAGTEVVSSLTNQCIIQYKSSCGD